MPRFSIRAKLLLLVLALLAVPYTGLEYLRETERHLRRALERNLAESVTAIAAPLHGRGDLFPPLRDGEGDGVFVHELGHPVQLDGYTDDWTNYLEWAETYGPAGRALGRAADVTPSFRLLVAAHGAYLYALLRVRDATPVLQDAPTDLDVDRVELVFAGATGRLRHYVFATSAPGRLSPVEMVRTPHRGERRVPVTNVVAEWQSAAGGYTLEVRIPQHVVGSRLGFVVHDARGAGTPTRRAATAGARTHLQPGRLLRTSPALEHMLTRSVGDAGRRVWVLDRHAQVRASAGTLRRPGRPPAVNPLYALVLPPVSENFTDVLAGASRLQGAEVRAALAGRAETRWRASPEGRAAIVSAARPVYVAGEVRGAVVVEETANVIQSIQRRAMASLFNKTFAVLVVVTAVLMGFASRLSWRILRLSREAEAAIDEHGRVVGDVGASRARDEIGDLSRSFSGMLARLRHYNDYLEGLASRLSHELRTPLAVVRSSLENLEAAPLDDDARRYLARAGEGAHRLGLLVSRLGEATRLEQALQASERERVDLGELVAGCLAGYRDAYPQTTFELHADPAPLAVHGAPDLIVQMLDKLIANARDFGAADRAVIVSLSRAGDRIELAVTNYGARLPETLAGDLFKSMVSVRENKGEEPHLGLGLYIVRLIAEFHGARASAANLEDEAGVRVAVAFPAA